MYRERERIMSIYIYICVSYTILSNLILYNLDRRSEQKKTLAKHKTKDNVADKPNDNKILLLTKENETKYKPDLGGQAERKENSNICL